MFGGCTNNVGSSLISAHARQGDGYVRDSEVSQTLRYILGQTSGYRPTRIKTKTKKPLYMDELLLHSPPRSDSNSL